MTKNSLAWIHCPPQIMLLTDDLNEHLIDIEHFTLYFVPSFQAPGIPNSKFDAP